MPTIAPFPHHYEVSFEEDQLLAPPRAPIAAGAPPQFGGTDQVWGPEELLVAAVVLCLKTTFDAYARKEGLTVHSFRASADGVLQKASGGPAFSAVQLKVSVQVPVEDESRARALLETAERNCIITRAIKAPVTMEVSINS